MPFGLKNTCITYQRLLEDVFSKQIGCNPEVYIDDMILKTSKEKRHTTDLEDILELVRNYNMRLNIDKFSFRVQSGKFLDFMLTKRGINVNPDKCQAIIGMRNPSNVKKVQ